MLSAIGSIFLGIGKGTHPLEPCPTGEFHEFLEIFIGFTGKSHHQRGTDMDSGNLLANPLYQFVGLCLGHMPAHTFQHPVRDVLQGNIEIFADIGLLTHHLQ